MKERDVLRMLLARRDNYAVTQVEHIRGRMYHVTMNGSRYNAVAVVSSFEFYTHRYHVAKHVPTLCICFLHDTVLAVPCLSLAKGNLAQPYELPEKITDLESQRLTRTGSQVLLGMYIAGMRVAQEMIDSLPKSSKHRYLNRAKALAEKPRGRPVAVVKTSSSQM